MRADMVDRWVRRDSAGRPRRRISVSPRAAAGGLGGAAAARRQARRPGARGAAAEADRGGASSCPASGSFPAAPSIPRTARARRGYRACAVRELEEEAGIALPADEELVLFSRWITPEVVSRRFDAWFFLALAPAHTPPQPDGVETTEAGWFEPARRPRGAGSRRDGPRLPDHQAARSRCSPSAPPTRRSRPTAAARSSRSCPR